MSFWVKPQTNKNTLSLPTSTWDKTCSTQTPLQYISSSVYPYILCMFVCVCRPLVLSLNATSVIELLRPVSAHLPLPEILSSILTDLYTLYFSPTSSVWSPRKFPTCLFLFDSFLWLSRPSFRVFSGNYFGSLLLLPHQFTQFVTIFFYFFFFSFFSPLPV